MADTTADAVTTYRAAAAALRRYRYTPPPTRNTGARNAAYSRHEDTMITAAATLIESGRRDVAGVLAEEADLVTRIRDSRRNGVDRPELRARLAAARRDIRAAIANG